MKQKWPQMRLDSLFSFIGGGTPARNNSSFYSGNIPWITVKDMRDDIIDSSELQITPEAISSSATNLIPAGTVIFATRVGLGKVGILSVDAAINQDLKAAAPRRNDIVPNYFLYWMKSNADVMVNAGVGATVKGVTLEFIRSLSLPLPSVDEQKRIVQVVSHVATQIKLRKRQIEKLDLLAKSRFIEMFGDSKAKFQKLGDVCGVGSSKRVFVEELQTKGIPFFRGTEVGRLAEDKDIEPTLFITEEHYISLCKYTGKPKIGDLLLPSICPDGRVWCVNSERPFYFKDGRVLWVKVPDAINGCYLRFALSQSIIENYSALASGITFAELKIVTLKEAPIPIPPLALQNEFAAFIEELDKSKFTIRQSLEKLETLYRALLQEYFG